MEKVYFYNSKRQKLAGVFHNQGDKGVIVSHGFASNKENVSMYTEFLQSKGYSTLAFDYSGHGESAGVLAETSAAKWEDDLNSAIDFMKQRCNKLALLGFSLGGMSSLLCSGRSDATVAIAPPTNFRKLAMHFIKSGLIKEFGKFIDFGGLNIKQTFITESAKYDMKKIMKNTKCPVLIVHGDKDDVVPLSQSEEVINYINEPKRLAVIRGFGHGSANEAQLGVITREIGEWLERYL